MDSLDVVQRDVRVVMTRPTLAGVARHALPPGYALTPYVPGDERHWVAIHERADRYNTAFDERFRRSFGEAGGRMDAGALAARQVYLRHLARDASPDASPDAAAGTPVGTATAWYDAADQDADGTPVGRVHWVALVPEHQGRGLAKPLLAWVLARLAALGHRRAVLDTSTARVVAINLYRQFGFRPGVRPGAAEAAADRAVWRELAPHLRPPLAPEELP